MYSKFMKTGSSKKSKASGDKREMAVGNKSKVSHQSVKGTPMPKGGKSRMEAAREKQSKDVTLPGEKKFGSNSMSPCEYEGRVNEYGNGRDNHK